MFLADVLNHYKLKPRLGPIFHCDHKTVYVEWSALVLEHDVCAYAGNSVYLFQSAGCTALPVHYPSFPQPHTLPSGLQLCWESVMPFNCLLSARETMIWRAWMYWRTDTARNRVTQTINIQKQLTLSNRVWLNIAIIVLACPDETSFRLKSLCYHVVNQSVFIHDSLCFKLHPIFSKHNISISSS